MDRETLTAHAGTTPVARATIEPYVDGVPGPRFYQRYAHAVGVEAERLLGELDGGRALLFPSGMAAVCSLAMATLQPGATVAVADGGYFGTVGLLRGELSRWGLEVIGFDQTGPPPPADLVWLEPCSNPMLTFPDLDESIAAAHAAGARVAVDNTVLSPLLLRPLEHGADFVVHSATKILAGHHDALLGVVVCARDEDAERLLEWRSHAGIVAAPDPAWLLLRGLKTLGVRVPRQSATALELARRLCDHPAVQTVRYPGLGPDPRCRPLHRGVRADPVVRRRRRRRRRAGRAVAVADRERDQPRRHRDHARGPLPLGGRPGARGAAAAQRGPGGGRRPLGRPGRRRSTPAPAVSILPRAAAIRDAIVPVAGLGTRLLPATRSAPKEMLPIVDKPVVQYVVEELSRAGIDRVLMVTGRRKRAIEDHFDADPELAESPPPAAGVQLFYTRQPTPAGLGDAVARGDGFADPSSPGVVVALGDAILEPRSDGGPEIVARLIDAHAAYGADATIAVTEVPPAQTGRYGIVIGSPPLEHRLRPRRATARPRRRRARSHADRREADARARSTARLRSPHATCSGRRCSRRCVTRRPAPAARSS